MWIFISKNLSFIIGLVLGCLSFGCCCCMADDQDTQLVESFKGLYRREPGDSPARYALNQIAATNSWMAFRILAGEFPSTPEMKRDSRTHLLKLKADIKRGLEWPIKVPPSFNIPFTNQPPIIDGNLDDICWRDSLIFNGEFPINSTIKRDQSSLWKMMYDKENIYIGVSFKDSDLNAVDYIPEQKGPWDGDAVEVFIMPSKQLKDYREVVIGCGGVLFSSLHVNNRWSTYINGDEPTPKTIKGKCRIRKDGFSAELAIPFRELPNYMLGNPPQPGQKIYFALVRTDKHASTDKPEFYSALPLLYGSHNVFGYATGILE